MRRVMICNIFISIYINDKIVNISDIYQVYGSIKKLFVTVARVERQFASSERDGKLPRGQIRMTRRERFITRE